MSQWDNARVVQHASNKLYYISDAKLNYAYSHGRKEWVNNFFDNNGLSDCFFIDADSANKFLKKNTPKPKLSQVPPGTKFTFNEKGFVWIKTDKTEFNESVNQRVYKVVREQTGYLTSSEDVEIIIKT